MGQSVASDELVLFRGWHEDGTKWYYYDNNGNKVKGWKLDGDKWYYLNENGEMVTGWLQDNDKWYYLLTKSDSSKGEYEGMMLSSCWRQLDNDRWFYFNANGDMQTGWIKLNNSAGEEKWYYMVPQQDLSIPEYKGMMLENTTRTINGVSYTFNSSGEMQDYSGTADGSLVTNKLIEFIKAYEGFYPNHYFCPAGVDTIGYGTTTGWLMAYTTVTEAQATAALKEDVNDFSQAIKEDLDSRGVSLSQCQFDALVSFAYNCGKSALLSQSTLYRNICAGVRDSDTLYANFTSWSNVSGSVCQGLLNRRIEEWEMFMNGDYERTR